MNEGDSQVLTAFRNITGWSDEQVRHYETCAVCEPICGYEEYDCRESPKHRARLAHPARVMPVLPPEPQCYRAPAGFMVHYRRTCRCPS